MKVNITFSNEIKVYPNPTSTSVNITLPPEIEKYQIDIHDIMGKLVYTEIQNENSTTEIEIGTWTEGVYIVNVTANGISKRTKFLISK